MTQKGKSRNVLASPLGEEGHEVAKGVQANWIHRRASRPANPVRRHPAKSVCTRVRMIMILDVDVTAERRHYNTHCPLKGKRLTTFCASLRSGGRRLAVRKMIECHIPAQTRTPFPASRDFPSRGNKGHGEKNRRVIYFNVPFRCVPLWWLAPPPCPRSSVGRQKESALMGRLGALLRPTWRSYAGPPQWHYNPCLL